MDPARPAWPPESPFLPLSHRVELGNSARVEHQSHRQSLGDVVHPQGKGDEVPEAGPPVAAEGDSDPHALREGVQRHDEHDKEHLFRRFAASHSVSQSTLNVSAGCGCVLI